MLQATVALAQRIERTEIDFCAVGAGVGQPGGAASIEVAGGKAVCGVLGSPMNKVLGLGLGVTVTDADLDAIELFYDERECPIQIELCPLVSIDLVAKLQARDYVLKGFENQLACALPVDVSPGNGLRVDVLTGNADEDVWLRATSEGFAVPDSVLAPEAPDAEVVESLGVIMRQFVHPDTVRYLVRVNGEPAGAAASVILRGVLGIFGTATRPAYRRRGVQAAIVARALQEAVGQADLAIATVEPGSISQRTFERFRFQVLYTRAIMVRS
ncbi:MAG TPA: GNAT family N-acetyltransferase [Vicinamibacterales bacterium]|nr:GNAT family N-acetyltransferase [Vicinamibacterales bacterium]